MFLGTPAFFLSYFVVIFLFFVFENLRILLVSLRHGGLCVQGDGVVETRFFEGLLSRSQVVQSFSTVTVIEWKKIVQSDNWVS